MTNNIAGRLLPAIVIMAAMTIPAGGLMAASPASGLDSVQSIPDLVVTGTRDRTDVRHLSQTVSIVGRETIEHSMEPSLLPVLSAEVPGLFVTERGVLGYGSSGGSAGGISIRGLSGGNARMMVLIDGHPQYAGIFGHPISDSYQSLLADKVEVLRGPASVLYGSNAMGGVVNIVTRRMHGDGVRTHVGVGYGSYNTLETEVTNTVRKHGFNSVVSASYNRTDGHRKDMGFEQYGGYAKVGYDFSSHWQAFADVNVTHYNAHCPGPDYAPLVDGYQRITRGVASMVVSNEYDRTSGAVSFFYNWGNHWINDGYTPSNGQTGQDGRFKSYDDMIGVSAYQSTRFWQGNRITLGFDWFRYGGKAWTDYVAGPQEGTRRDLVNKHEDEYAGYMDFRQDLSTPYQAPFQPSVAHYTDNYVLLISGSKAFSYAGQRIGVSCISDKLYHRSYPGLTKRYGGGTFGTVFIHRVLYALSSGTSHSAQYAMAAMLKAANEGQYNFLSEVKVYGDRAQKLKEIFLRHGFYLVYDNDLGDPIADGFYFTIGYPGMTSGELAKELMYYGVSAISLVTTGSHQEGLRACTSFIKDHQYAQLDERMKLFAEHHPIA